MEYSPGCVVDCDEVVVVSDDVVDIVGPPEVAVESPDVVDPSEVVVVSSDVDVVPTVVVVELMEKNVVLDDTVDPDVVAVVIVVVVVINSL